MTRGIPDFVQLVQNAHTQALYDLEEQQARDRRREPESAEPIEPPKAA